MAAGCLGSHMPLNGDFAADILRKTLAGGPPFTSIFLGLLWNLHGDVHTSVEFAWGDG